MRLRLTWTLETNGCRQRYARASTGCVDLVVWFDEATPTRIDLRVDDHHVKARRGPVDLAAAQEMAEDSAREFLCDRLTETREALRVLDPESPESPRSPTEQP